MSRNLSGAAALAAFLFAVAFPAGVEAQRALPILAPSQAAADADPSDPFFDDTVLHEIRLTINSRDWNALKEHYLENTYYACDMRWKDEVVRNVGIRSRGTGSRSGTKPGLRVDFDRYTTKQKFLGLKSFILRNNTQDASGMHERISMAFFRRMGMPASREAHAKLFINNEYAGLYTIVESVDKNFLGKTFGNDEGHLFKYDYNATDEPYYFEHKGSDPGLYVPLPFKPETHEDDAQPEFVERWIRTINETADSAFRAVMAEYLELEKFVRHIAIEMFLADQDGFNGNWGTNNFYVYRHANQSLFTFLPWDKSNTFIDGPEYSIFHNIDNKPSWQVNRLTARVLEQSDLRRLFLDTLLEAADAFVATADPGAATERPAVPWIEWEIQRQYDQIRDAARTDPDRPDPEQFEQSVEEMRRFARERSDNVRRQVEAALRR